MSKYGKRGVIDDSQYNIFRSGCRAIAKEVLKNVKTFTKTMLLGIKSVILHNMKTKRPTVIFVPFTVKMVLFSFKYSIKHIMESAK